MTERVGPERGAAPGEGGSEPPDAPDAPDLVLTAGPYLFADMRRRRTAGVLYSAVAAGCLAAGLAAGNGGFLAAAGLLAAVALYHFACAWPLRVDQTEALATAGRAVGFPIGHASAQLAWRGLRSRPTWRVLLYSAEEPPATRGLVELDAVDGTVLGQYTEDNPEDWSQYGTPADAAEHDA